MIRALLVLFLVFGIGYAETKRDIATDIAKITYPKGSLQSYLNLSINFNPQYDRNTKKGNFKVFKKS